MEDKLQTIGELTSTKHELTQETRLLKEELQERHQRLLESNKELRQMATNATDLERKLDDALKEQAQVSRLESTNESLQQSFVEKETKLRRELQRLSNSLESQTEKHQREFKTFKGSQENILADRDQKMASMAKEMESLKYHNSALEERLLESWIHSKCLQIEAGSAKPSHCG